MRALTALLFRFRRRLLWWALAIAALLAAVVGALWGLQHIFEQREAGFRHRVEAGLVAINALQAQSLTAWRSALVADADRLTDDSLLTEAVARWLRAPMLARQSPLDERLRSVQERGHYASVALLDVGGALRITTQGQALGWLAAPEEAALRQALQEARAVVVETHQDPRFPYPFLGVIAPLFVGDEAVGAFWLVLDVRAALYPLLKDWPTATRTGEAMLLQGRGALLQYITPLSLPSAQAQGGLVVMDNPQDVAVQAVRGQSGNLYGVDYRGVPVLAAARAVPDSPWVLVSKIDLADAYSDIDRSKSLSLALVVSLALLLGGCAAALWQWRGRQREAALKRQLQRNLQWLDTAQKAASVGYFLYDAQGEQFFMSSMACTIFGIPAQPFTSLKQWMALLHPQERDAVLQAHAQAMASGEALRIQYRIQRGRDGAPRWVQVWGEHEAQSEEGGAKMSGTVQDITERKSTEQALDDYRQHLEAQVRLDALTQVANRRALDEAAAHEWTRAALTGRSLAVLMIDVDHFKAYNDQYGHGAGDECLRRVAAALAASVQRSGELLARYGGEEFSVLLPACDGLQALQTAERLRQAVLNMGLEHQGNSCAAVVTVSIGAACCQPTSMGAVAMLFEQADAALYRAKQTGRNRVMSFGDPTAEPLAAATINSA